MGSRRRIGSSHVRVPLVTGAWCQIEVLMAYAFMTQGEMLLVVGSGFRNCEAWRLKSESFELKDPAACQIRSSFAS